MVCLMILMASWSRPEAMAEMNPGMLQPAGQESSQGPRQSPQCAEMMRSRLWRRMASSSALEVSTTIPSDTAVLQPGMKRFCPLISTMQSQQEPLDGRASWKHRVGIWMPLLRAASRIETPGSTDMLRPSMVSVTGFMVSVVSWLPFGNATWLAIRRTLMRAGQGNHGRMSFRYAARPSRGATSGSRLRHRFLRSPQAGFRQ